MGLDTVELIIETEKLFDTSLPQRALEEARTVQDLADLIFKHIVPTSGQFFVYRNFSDKVDQVLINELSIPQEKLYPSVKLFELFPMERRTEHWLKLALALKVSLPNLTRSDQSAIEPGTTKSKWTILKSKSPVLNFTLQDLKDWIVSIDHERYIDPKRISTKYEVERMIVGILHHRFMIDITELQLHKKIVDDLGLD